MRKNVIKVVMLLFFAVFGLSGCGGEGGTSVPANSADSSDNLLTGVEGFFTNSAPDYTNDGVTCVLTFHLYYSKSIAVNDIESVSITAQNGSSCSGDASNFRFETDSNGDPFIDVSIYESENPQTSLLAGIWITTIKLKNGDTSSLQLTLHEPGSIFDATHPYLYTKEDWTPLTNPTEYVAALGRFPSQGYTLQYSSTGDGSITSTGLSATMTSFHMAEPSAYNFLCWLYDENKSYLGYTITEYSLSSHSRTNLITANGELSIVPASTNSSTGNVDLSKVKYIRFIFVDGAQYAPTSYACWDYKSISALVPVNRTENE